MSLTCETCGADIVDVAEMRQQGELHNDDTLPYLHVNLEGNFYFKRDHPARPAHVIKHGLERTWFLPLLPTPTLADEIAESRRIAEFISTQPHAE